MAKKHVHSEDPRKSAIVAALKHKSGGTKVTLLVELEPGKLFEGKCMKPRTRTNAFKNWNGSMARYEDLGMFQVTASEVSQITGKGR